MSIFSEILSYLVVNLFLKKQMHLSFQIRKCVIKDQFTKLHKTPFKLYHNLSLKSNLKTKKNP